MSFRESRGSFATSSAIPAKVSTYGSDFQRLSKVISINVQKIRSNVHQMKTMLKELSTKPDDTLKLSKLHEVQQKTNTLVKETGNYVQDFNKIPLQSNVPEQKHKKLQRDRLVSDFSNALDDFQTVQKEEKEKTKAQVVRDRQSVKHMKGVSHDHSAETSTAAFQPSQQQQVMVLQEISDVELDLMREREEDLKNLEAGIRDVHQIFLNLNEMINEQGEILDRIEDNVESAAANVEKGTVELKKADDAIKSIRKKKLIIAIVVLVIVAIIVTIILASVLSAKK